MSARTIGNPPLQKGPTEGRTIPLDQMMKGYWEEMGWDPDTGQPPRATFKQLNILRPATPMVRNGSLGAAYSITSACVGCSVCVERCLTKSITGELGRLHSIEREACIECGVCGKFCPNKAIVDSRGNAAISINPVEWPKPIFDKKACVSCNMCIQSCPVGCLSLSEASAKELDRHPIMENPTLCIACGFCAEECPVDAIHMV